MEYILCYDLETTGLKYTDDEIVQFSALVLDTNLEKIETINIFHATPVSDFILNLHGKTQAFYNTHGTDKITFIYKIEEVFNKYNIKYLLGHNIIGFDNEWLDYHTNIKTSNYRSVDTMKIEQKLLKCNNYGYVLDAHGSKTGEKVSRKLKSCCIRRGVDFNEKEAHDGLYDCQKTLDLYLKHKVLEKETKLNAKVPVTNYVSNIDESTKLQKEIEGLKIENDQMKEMLIIINEKHDVLYDELNILIDKYNKTIIELNSDIAQLKSSNKFKFKPKKKRNQKNYKI